MKAIVCEQIGQPFEHVRYRELPDPTPGPGQVLIETKAMGLNFPDVLQVQDLYQTKQACPYVVGMELAGIVKAIGPGVTRVAVGQRVAALSLGAFAEFVAVREGGCYSMPDDMSFEAGAALPLAGGTAMYGLTRRGQVKPGETLAVLGAAGGTGSSAVQIGKALGARVIAICSTQAKADIARDLGADDVIVLDNEDLSARLMALTDGRGVDALYDPVGGKAFDTASRRIAWNGRALVVGFASGTIPSVTTNLALLKGYSIVGVHWAAALQREQDTTDAVVRELFELCAQGRFKPLIESRFGLEDGVAALRMMNERRAMGKIILVR